MITESNNKEARGAKRLPPPYYVKRFYNGRRGVEELLSDVIKAHLA